MGNSVIEDENDREIIAASEFALASDYPDAVEIYRDVYEQEIAA